MAEQKQSIAIIGSGITGLSAAWLLHDKYDVTLFEKNDYLGGHTHTHDVTESDKHLAIDSGFIVYNEKNYPNLVGLFEHLNVETQATDMSFAFSMNQGQLEYAGSGLRGMFAQPSNLISPKHWKLLKEIVRFNKTAHAQLSQLENEKSYDYTLGEFLDKNNFSIDLQNHYLLPMAAAIWSCPVDTMHSFPAFSFLRFFANHGLIDLQNRPQWRSVVGGSREYIRKMMPVLDNHIKLKDGAKTVIRDNKNVSVICNDETLQYDKLIFACHADEALQLLQNPSAQEQEILGCFQYQENITYLHSDESLMPKRRKAWCSWNYLAQSGREASESKVTATYWMNNLQNLDTEKDYLVTLNPFTEIDQNKVIKKMIYHHPVFNREAMFAQTRLDNLQDQQNSYFCGSYAGYGFHEDALNASVKVCEKLGVIAPWNLPSKYQKEVVGGSQ